MSPELACSLSAAWAAVGSLLSSVGWIRDFALLKDDGCLSWRLALSRPQLKRFRLKERTCFLLFNEKVAALMLGLRVVAGLAILLTWGSLEIVAVCAPLLLLSYGWFVLRQHPLGVNGGDRMAALVFAALSLLFVESRVAVFSIPIFLGAQGALAYLTAGISKLSQERWRSGSNLRILAQAGWFDSQAFEFLDRRGLVPLASWAIILGQLCIPISLFCGPGLRGLFLLNGALFHLANRRFLGIGGFFFPWTATYPSLWFLAEFLRA